MAKVTRMVTLSDEVIRSIASDARYAVVLPCIREELPKLAEARQKAGCGKCARKLRAAQSATAGSLERMKACIIGMGSEQRVKFKALLGTALVKIFRRQGNKVTPLIF